MTPHLVALSEGPNLSLTRPIVLIGRHQECDIQIPSRKISRRHCCLAQVADYLVVRDLGSTNGVRINGVRVLEGELRDGDELTIGNVRFQVRWSDQALPPRDALSGEVPVALPESLSADPAPLAKPFNPPPAAPFLPLDSSAEHRPLS